MFVFWVEPGLDSTQTCLWNCICHRFTQDSIVVCFEFTNDSDVVEIVTFETVTETWLKVRDDTETSTKALRPGLGTWSSRPRLETSNFVYFTEIKKKMSSSLRTWFFLSSGIFRHVLLVSYLQTQQTKNRWIIEILINHFFTIFKVMKPRDRDSQKWFSRPRPSLETPSLTSDDTNATRLLHWLQNIHLHAISMNINYFIVCGCRAPTRGRGWQCPGAALFWGSTFGEKKE